MGAVSAVLPASVSGFIASAVSTLSLELSLLGVSALFAPPVESPLLEADSLEEEVEADFTPS
ncbi:MAG: hypothetical protein R2748_18000 [Bryobacterales bacterium]